ncbi:MAG: hypothetical protein J3R72DRAFT_465417 [Linnemannia gamsii]|nr:MAG: hypothetical protein J3R72DRAFT_465417 [Linnemannia gamsii]
MATPKLIVLYDGTWCGLEANTKTNIYRLADLIMNPLNPFNTNPAAPYFDPFNTTPAAPYIDPAHQITACYFPGPGVGGTFLDNLTYGATGNDINLNCIEVYQYIVQNYNLGDEIWMFGLSRGAYTIRCVAGMINNCGILILPNIGLCNQVYDTYRSRLPTNHPSHPNMVAFRAGNSHIIQMPVKFMGLFDTVGSLGIPYFTPGIGLAFHQFHDISISTAVEKVYHALSIHDRLWGFEPCHAMPSPSRIAAPAAPPPAPQFEIRERWFPGCHYDLGRQRFRFLQNGSNFLERAVNWALNPLSQIIEPNSVFADLVLKWMLERIQENDPLALVIPTMPATITNLIASMVAATPADTGHGDIYDNLLNYGPLGALGGYLFRVASKLIPRFGFAIHVLTRTREREIDPGAELTEYTNICGYLGGTVGAHGGISVTRYPSHTYNSFTAIPYSPLNPQNPMSSPC